jgi:anti-sigma regulatory factor (Ser/Thr protein kinase)
MATPLAESRGKSLGFRHGALIYEGEAEFIESVGTFVREGIEADESVMVVVPGADRIDGLRVALGEAAAGVEFADMLDIGRNPATILPLWRDFLDRSLARGRSARGVGEPVWAGRGAPELVECRLHESLLNVEFDDGPPWRLLCPYDKATLSSESIGAAISSHPFVSRRRQTRQHEIDRDVEQDEPLPAPTLDHSLLAFDSGTLSAMRSMVADQAVEAGVAPNRRADVVLAAAELASNSVAHGGGSGLLRSWIADDSFVLEVSDAGRLCDPMAGRRLPSIDQPAGRGLWIVNHLCDLTQIRSSPSGTTVRIWFRLR